MSKAMVNGVELNYEEYGSGEETLVFVHGYNGRATLYADFFALFPENYHIYAFDMRSQGGSAHVTEGVSFDQWADDVYQLAQALGLTKFVYAGHSAGGGVGMKLALSHPECLKGLVLLCTFPAAGTDEVPPDVIEQSIKSWRNKEMITSMFGSFMVKPYAEEMLAEWVDSACLVEKEPFIHFITNEASRYNVLDRLGEIETPTLLVYGAKDNVCLPEGQHQTAQGLPNSKEVIFSDEGHMMPVETPHRPAQEMISFISQLD